MAQFANSESGASVRTKINAAIATVDGLGSGNNLLLSAAERAKLAFLTATGAIDLDAVNTRVNALDAAVILKGTWNASVGTFPGAGTAQAGESWIVSVGGTVDGVDFAANDRIIAILDNASTTTYAANWHKADYTDQVLSVAGLTGAVSAAAIKAAMGQFVTADYANNSVTFAKLVAAATGTSIIGKAATGAGNYTEIVAGTNTVLLRVAGDMIFGKLSTVHFNNTIITNAILANMTAPSIKGRITAGAGPVEDLTPAQVVSILDTELGGTAWRATAAGGGATYFNGSGGTLAKGTPVALASFDAGSGNPGMVAADADGSGLMPCIGILGAAVANGASGAPIISGGEITGLDTSAYALGDKLYVSTTAGVLTKVRPTTGFIQAVAVVSRVDAVNGEIIVQIEEAGELYTEYLMMAASDEATNLSVGTAKITLWAPFAMVITKIKANVITAPTGSTLQVDVNEAGVSIFSTPITIDAGEDTSETAAVPQVISDANIADNAKITVDIDQVGATVAGKGLKLTFYGYRA